MWNQHLDESPIVPNDEPFDALDEHEEPVARAARQRAVVLRRHKDLTAEDIALSGRLWRWGFAALPFLWLINYVFFRHALVEQTTPDSMKRQVRQSMWAFAIAFVVWLVWLIVFYTNMRGWAEPLLLLSPDTNVLD